MTTWGQPPTAVRRSEAPQKLVTITNLSSCADWTAEGGCPHMVLTAIIKNCAHAYDASDSFHYSS
jgi:hypothetical protein